MASGRQLSKRRATAPGMGCDPTERLRAVWDLPEQPSSCAALLEAAADPSLDVAAAALRRLAQLGGEDEARQLRCRLLEVDLGIVPAYAATLRALRDSEAAAVARDGLSDPALSVRLAAAIALRELGDRTSVPALLVATVDPVAGVRRFSLEALGRLGRNPESENACAAAVGDPDTEVRAAAVRALGETASDLEARLQPVVDDPAPRVRREAARFSAHLSDGLVSELLRDVAAGVRAEALWALVARPRPSLIDVVARAIDDPDWHVRRAACRALGAARNDRAGSGLLHGLTDPHSTVRAAAARALAEIFGPRLVDVLVEGLRVADPTLRKALVYQLAGVADKASAASIAKLSGDESVEVRVAVAHALAEVGEPDVISVLETLVRDESIEVRAAAEIALERVRGADAG